MLNLPASELGIKETDLLPKKLSELQKTINERQYQVPVNVLNIPRPQQSNEIDQILAQQWVNAHPDNESEAIAQLIIDNSTHIGQSEFEKRLLQCAEIINKNILESEDYIVLTRPGKSNQWTTELAFPVLKKLPTNVLDISELDTLQDTQTKKLLVQKNIVFFDDALYSGGDMAHNVKVALRILKENGINLDGISIYIAVPYSTERGLARIQEETKNFPEVKLVFTNPEKILSINDLPIDESKKHAIQKMYGLSDLHMNHKTLTWLAHKSPDRLSTLGALTEGEVYNSTGKEVNDPDSGKQKKIRFIPKTESPYKKTVAEN